MNFSPYRLIGTALVLLVGGRMYIGARKTIKEEERLDAEQIAAGMPPSFAQSRYPWLRGAAISLGLAAFYLLVFRLLSLVPPFYLDDKGGPILMSAAFLFLGPFVAGFFTVHLPLRTEPWPVKAWILAPWFPVCINVLLALSVAWEGIICVVFILPPALLSASLGGVAAGLLHRFGRRHLSNGSLVCLAALPLILAVVETKIHQPLQTRTVNTSILIHAPAPVVWQNIESVHAIHPTELRHSWANAIGFPRPVEATLSHEGVGGVRNASFERGLNFTETVTEWVPNQRIAFTIKADTAAIPSTTLDEHVTVGGRFFDVLTGEYQVEPLADGTVLLHLASHQRLSTDFNFYAALWSDAVMSDMQNNILHVIQQRCEHEASANANLLDKRQ